MLKEGLFAYVSLWKKLLITLCIVLIGLFLTLFFFGIISYGLDPKGFASDQATMSLFKLRLLQIMQSFFVFIFPAMLLAVWFSFSPKDYLYLTRQNKTSLYILVGLTGITILPLINWLAYLNEQIRFPEFLSELEQSLMESERQANATMEMFLQMDTPWNFLFNLFMIGILTAIAEEFFFRGILQRLFTDHFKNVHLAIWLSAFIFSAIHMQFYGFIPRLLLGAYLGYLLWWSKSLWLPILAHFVNNAIAVSISYLEQHHVVEPGLDSVGMHGETAIVIVSFITSVILLIAIFRCTRTDSIKKQTPTQ